MFDEQMEKLPTTFSEKCLMNTYVVLLIHMSACAKCEIVMAQLP